MCPGMNSSYTNCTGRVRTTFFTPRWRPTHRPKKVVPSYATMEVGRTG